jgi:hypothetical protein
MKIYHKLLIYLLSISSSLILTNCKQQYSHLNKILSAPCDTETTNEEGEIKCYKNVDGKRYILDFYENGQVKTIYEMKLDEHDKIIFHGVVKEFYDTGELKMESSYLDNSLNGSVKFYYNDGKLETEGTYLAGHIIDESKSYYNNGNLKYYVFRDRDGNTRYYREYNKLGQLVKEEGNAIAYVLYSSDNSNVKIGDTITSKYKVANPPNTVIDLKLLVDNDNLDLKNLDPLKWSHVFNFSGKYKMKAVLQMRDIKSNKTKLDSLITEITVVEP